VSLAQATGFEVLNNRELAALLLLMACLAAALVVRPIRLSLGKVVGTLLAPKLLALLLAMLGYVGSLLWLGYEIRLWSWDLASETATWFVGSALVLFLNVADASRQKGFFRRVVLQTFGVTLLVDFFLNDLFVLNLPVELALQVAATILLLLSMVAGRKPEYLRVKTIADALLSLIGLALVGFIVVQTVKQWDQVTTQATLLELVLPVWLTMSLLPFIYLVSVLLSYESAFSRIDWALDDPPGGSWRVKLALVTVLRGRRLDASAFAGGWAREAAAAPSFRAARRAIKEYRASRRQKEADEKEARERLERNAGVLGTEPPRESWRL